MNQVNEPAAVLSVTPEMAISVPLHASTNDSPGSNPEISMEIQQDLGPDIAMAFEPEQKYENPDGTQIVFDTDILGAKRGEKPIPGAFVNASDAQKDLF